MSNFLSISYYLFLFLGLTIATTIPFEPNKEYSFQFKSKLSMPIAHLMTIENTLTTTLFVRKQIDDSLICYMKDAEAAGLLGLGSDAFKLETPFKVILDEKGHVKEILSSNDWEAGIIIKKGIIDLLVYQIEQHKYYFQQFNTRTTTSNGGQQIFKDLYEVNLPMGVCNASMTIIEHGNEIDVIAEASKDKCILDESMKKNIAGIEIGSTIAQDSLTGMTITFDKETEHVNRMKETMDVTIGYMGLTAKIHRRLTLDYLNEKFVSDKIELGNPLITYTDKDFARMVEEAAEMM